MSGKKPAHNCLDPDQPCALYHQLDIDPGRTEEIARLKAEVERLTEGWDEARELLAKERNLTKFIRNHRSGTLDLIFQIKSLEKDLAHAREMSEQAIEGSIQAKVAAEKERDDIDGVCARMIIERDEARKELANFQHLDLAALDHAAADNATRYLDLARKASKHVSRLLEFVKISIPALKYKGIPITDDRVRLAMDFKTTHPELLEKP